MMSSLKNTVTTFFIVALLFTHVTSASAKNTIRIAVLPLQIVPGAEDYTWLSTALTDMITQSLSWSPQVTIAVSNSRASLLNRTAQQLPYNASNAVLKRTLTELNLDAIVFGRFQQHAQTIKMEFKSARLKKRVSTIKLLSITGSIDTILGLPSQVAEYFHIKNQIPLSPKTSQFYQQAVSSSAYALRSYGASLQSYRHGDFLNAMQEASNSIGYDGNLMFARKLLADAMYSVGKVEETIAAYQNALSDSKRELGNNHPFIVDLSNQYGQVLRNFSLPKKAQHELKEDLKRAQIVYGNDHTKTAMVMSNLAAAYTSNNNLNAASSLLESALSIIHKQLGVKHPKVAELSGNLAMLYYVKKDYRSATRYARLAVQLAEHTLPPDHPSLAIFYKQLALILAGTGLYSEALQYSETALDLLDKVYGEYHPLTIQAFSNTGAVYFATSSFDKAMINYKKALKRSQQLYGNFHPATAEELTNVAGVYFQKGAFEKARELYLQALNIFQNYHMISSSNFVKKQLSLINYKLKL